MKKVLVFLLVTVMIVPCFSLMVSADDLENVAQGKHYTVDIGDGTPGYSVPDPDDGSGFGDGVNAVRQRLTDGVLGEGDGGIAGLIGAQNTAKAIYVIDLGSVVDGIKKLNMDMYSGTWGIADDISVEYAVSTDGTNYTPVGTVLLEDAVSKGGDVWKAHNYILELATAQSARYVKITASATNYVWSSEIQVFAENAGDDEDSQTDDDDSQTGDEDSQTGDEDSQTGDEDSQTGDEDSQTGNEDSQTGDEDSQTSDEDSQTSNEDSQTSNEDPKTGDYNIFVIFAILTVISIYCFYVSSKKRAVE